MKTREEQLKEMAKQLCSSFNSEYCHRDCSKFCGCRVLIHCEALQYAGYRKQSDIVREFVERLRKKEHCCEDGHIVYWVVDIDDVLAISAEYGAEVEE